MCLLKPTTSLDSTNWSLAAAWQPADSGLMPSISTGWSKSDAQTGTNELSTWYVGLEVV